MSASLSFPPSMTVPELTSEAINTIVDALEDEVRAPTDGLHLVGAKILTGEPRLVLEKYGACRTKSYMDSRYKIVTKPIWAKHHYGAMRSAIGRAKAWQETQRSILAPGDEFEDIKFHLKVAEEFERVKCTLKSDIEREIRGVLYPWGDAVRAEIRRRRVTFIKGVQSINKTSLLQVLALFGDMTDRNDYPLLIELWKLRAVQKIAPKRFDTVSRRNAPFNSWGRFLLREFISYPDGVALVDDVLCRFNDLWRDEDCPSVTAWLTNLSSPAAFYEEWASIRDEYNMERTPARIFAALVAADRVDILEMLCKHVEVGKLFIKSIFRGMQLMNVYCSWQSDHLCLSLLSDRMKLFFFQPCGKKEAMKPFTMSFPDHQQQLNVPTSEWDITRRAERSTYAHIALWPLVRAHFKMFHIAWFWYGEMQKKRCFAMNDADTGEALMIGEDAKAMRDEYAATIGVKPVKLQKVSNFETAKALARAENQLIRAREAAS